MANPAQQSTGSDPEAGRDDQPENAAPDCAVVNLPDAGNDQAQDCRCARIFHFVSVLLLQFGYEGRRDKDAEISSGRKAIKKPSDSGRLVWWRARICLQFRRLQ